MLIYRIDKIPDLTLSKYQVFAQSGIEGLLESQTQFIKSLQKIALLGDIGIHLFYIYDPLALAGQRLKIFLVFSNIRMNDNYTNIIKKFVQASNLNRYYNMNEIQDTSVLDNNYQNSAILFKYERALQAVINNEEKLFYVVPNWEVNEEARLFNMFNMMETFNERCCYRVDLYAQKELDEEIHQSFENPLKYLRNINNIGKGISELSRLQENKRDPNADETLKQYEEWIKKVDSSVVFRGRIWAFSDNDLYTEILLDSVVNESLSKGKYSTITDKNPVSSLTKMNNREFSFTVGGAPQSLKKWTSTYTAEEISVFSRLPALYDGENIEIPKETAATLDNNGIVLGKDTSGHSVTIDEKALPKHMFVCGVPGSGKTNTMLHLANSLWHYQRIDEIGHKKEINIPFLVFEPAKREYRELALFDIPELLIFSPSANTNFPLRINPFEFPIGLTLSEHISKLCAVFEGAFPIPSPAPFILDKAIQAVYERHGWNVKDVNNGDKEYPILSELYEQFEKELLATNYDGEIRGNIRSVLEMRIGSLLRREMKEIFDVKKSILSPEEWLDYPIIIELEALGEGPANFVTLLLCTLIRETLKVNPLANPDMIVRHVIFIEEAHNLIAPQATVENGMDSNPKVAATAFIVKMLAEVRALREGIIIADQLPTAMAPEVIKNTNIKLVHRLTSIDDRELVGSTMSASGLQMENMATYTSGQALFSYEKLLRPFEMQVSLVEEHGTSTPSDDELYNYMMHKDGFIELSRREEARKFEELKNEVIELNKTVVALSHGLDEYNFDKMNKADFEDVMQFYADNIKLIDMSCQAYNKKCSSISKRFVSRKRIDALSNLINRINDSLFKKFERLIYKSM